MLTTQYRMHPEISIWPGKRFYDGELCDAPPLLTMARSPWHDHRCLGPYVFYDVADGCAWGEGDTSWHTPLTRPP